MPNGQDEIHTNYARTVAIICRPSMTKRSNAIQSSEKKCARIILETARENEQLEMTKTEREREKDGSSNEDTENILGKKS